MPRKVQTTAHTQGAAKAKLTRLGAEESFIPHAHAIQWVGTNLGQIQAWWIGIELPAPRVYEHSGEERLGVWCNPIGGKAGYRLAHTTDWIVYYMGRVQLVTASGFGQFKSGHRALSGVSSA